MKIGVYVVWAAVASATGLLVLVGYFVDLALFDLLRLLLIQWAVLLAAASLLIGLFNLLMVHWTKVSIQDFGWPYSALLILVFMVTLALGLIFGPDYEVVLLLFQYVQVPIEASLLALLAITLTVAAFRMLARRRDMMSVVFLMTALIVLAGSAPPPTGGQTPQALAIARAWITQVWAAAGARGILIGVALGSVTAGLRVLMASDRPYGE